MKRLLFFAICCVSVAGFSQGLVINEMSQGDAGSREFVEFVVAGTKTCTDTSLDLRNWIVDDNNGWHGSGSNQGIAPGCIRFKNIPQWQNVRFGSIILLYNQGDKNVRITLPDDVSDANGDGVYVIPYNNGSVIEKDTITPSTSSAAYVTTNFYSGTIYASWSSVVGLRNAGDAFHTVAPSNLTTSYFSVGYGDLNLPASCSVFFSASGVGVAYANQNTVDNNPANLANWTVGSALTGSTFETPGLPNNVANGTWLLSMRNAPAPFTVRDTQKVQLCSGQSVTVNGHVYNATGLYRDTMPAANGCDSILVTNLNVITVQNLPVTLDSCKQVRYRGTTYTSGAVFADTLKSVGLCDSIIYAVTIVVRQPSSKSQTNTICQGSNYSIGSHSYTTAGVYVDTLANFVGCDSVVTTTIVVIAPLTQNIPLSGCGKVTYNGVDYFGNTTVRDTLKSVGGCDSVIHIVAISIGSYANRSKQVCITNGQAYFAGGSNQTTSGFYIDTIPAIGGGCDTILSTDLRVVTVNSPVQNFSSCKPITYNGSTYNTSAVLTDTIRTFLGCDSVISTVNITITPAVPDTVFNGVCILPGNSYTVNGHTYSSQLLYFDTLRTTAGCDSLIIFTDLRVVGNTNISQHVDSCFRASVFGKIYTRDTAFTDILKSQYGCDSITGSFTLTIHSPSLKLTTSASLPLLAGDSAEIMLQSVDTFRSVTWRPLAYISQYDKTQATAQPKTSRYFVATGIDTSGCVAVDSIFITVQDTVANPPKFAIPTAFTPNSDGRNDYFRILTNGNFQILNFRIYNRWGELIYDQPGDGDGWDGTYKNVKQPIGVYVYYLEIKEISTNEILRQEGNVTLLR